MFKIRSLSLNRRRIMRAGIVSLSALALTGVELAAVSAQNDNTVSDPETPPSREERQAILERYTHLWAATSPATKEGDTYTITMHNIGTTPVSAYLFTIIMDHRAHHNEAVIREEFQLQADEERTLIAENDYGTANHFSTRIFADTGNPSILHVSVSLTDTLGAETASFNEKAFWIESREEIADRREANRVGREDMNHHDHGSGHGVEEESKENAAGA